MVLIWPAVGVSYRKSALDRQTGRRRTQARPMLTRHRKRRRIIDRKPLKPAGSGRSDDASHQGAAA
jgi:hypothetical protein